MYFCPVQNDLVVWIDFQFLDLYPEIGIGGVVSRERRIEEGDWTLSLLIRAKNIVRGVEERLK